MSADAYGQVRERGEICGIPREAVAFAAGIHSVTGRTFQEIAGALALLGFGLFRADALENAVGSWGIERVEVALSGERPVAALVVKSPGGYKQ